MLTKEFLSAAYARFGIVGPAVSDTQILRVFPTPFPGRDDLMQFYLHQNGGSRTPQGCVMYCGNPAHEVARDQLAEMKLEGFYSVCDNAEERMLPFASLLRHHAAIKRTFARVAETRAFLERHRPIAFDHSGNGLWIDVESGVIRWMNWKTYKEGPVEIASSFQEFVGRFWIDAPVLEEESPCND